MNQFDLLCTCHGQHLAYNVQHDGIPFDVQQMVIDAINSS